MNCDNLVVLEIFGSIIFVTACIVESTVTALKLDKITADHASETAHKLARMAHWTSITPQDVCSMAFFHKWR